MSQKSTLQRHAIIHKTRTLLVLGIIQKLPKYFPMVGEIVDGGNTMSETTAPSKIKQLTGEDLMALGDIGPSELIDGRIVEMTPTSFQHGRIELKLGRYLDNFIETHKLGWVVVGEVGIYTARNPDRIRAADIVFISVEQMPSPHEGFLEEAPYLVVEIISENDRWQDLRKKIDEYFAFGVNQVWIVEPENHTVLVYLSVNEMQKYIHGDMLNGEGLLEGFNLIVDELFEG